MILYLEEKFEIFYLFYFFKCENWGCVKIQNLYSTKHFKKQNFLYIFSVSKRTVTNFNQNLLINIFQKNLIKKPLFRQISLVEGLFWLKGGRSWYDEKLKGGLNARFFDIFQQLLWKKATFFF